ncbi:PREDICTED: protein phosphatase Slingshot homolog 2 isoform X1 [Cyphomyrmex costatus]|uniref:protein phosphatase Slingshot homolog 2 isoform X1 n=2 Tax=Cyphomyrmex costatus TaxID=456900 RepID=UPI0008522E35|nr:PREDICTED: protein phosphatase Slingshot homolog 2 isoform X1 [Cyphomyrmex costatus]
MIVLKQKAGLHYGLPPPSPPHPPSPWSSILRGDDRRPRRRGRRVACGVRVTQLRDKVIAKDSGAGAPVDDEDTTRSCKSLSECYFAGKGAALVLPPNERARPSRRVSAAGCDIQQHLQSMFYLLRPEETLKMAVKLESVHPGRTRYLVVVSCTGRQDAEESCLLGIDCHARATVGLVLRVLADTAITLDGDGGFKVSVCGRQHIFKPVSVQAMWSALQTLHKVSGKAREQNYFLGGLSHDWVSYYEQRIESDRSCLNEWHAMDNLESKRPPSPDSVRTKPREREETERVIRSTLKEIMMSVDLDEVTSKYIRGRLEEDLDMDLGEFKPFIDQEMLTILGQMDAPTEIFDHVYLGSEWNASNLEELQKNGVRHILNVTREIDNFFPGMFTYLNVRVYDDEKTDLLKHWDNTFKYITKAKMEGSKVLVHCKMGVSRSASVVIAYAMKAYNWDFSQAWKHVKEKRNCIKPNNSFLLQLETYQGILDAMKNKEKLQRSKSDTNLKSPTSTKDQSKKEEKSDNIENNMREVSGSELKKTSQRPKSWSPNVKVAENMLPSVPLSQSLESIDKAGNTEVTREDLLRGSNQKTAIEQEARNVLMPCDNGQSYSVSQNKIMHLPAPTPGTPSVKNRISKLETQGQKRKGLVLNLTNQFEAASSKPSSPGSDTDAKSLPQSSTVEDNTKPIENGHSHCEQSQETQDITASVSSGLSGKETWDPGEEQREKRKEMSQESTEINDNSECLVWTASANVTCTDLCNDNKIDKGVSVESECNVSVMADTPATMSVTMMTTTTTTTLSTCHDGLGKKVKKEGDPFSAQLDRVFDREERRGEPVTRESPSRQSSWSSYDSAVVLDNNSVHSSWATLPSRNSSWGSYDMRPSDLLGSSGLFPYDKEEIPWHPGTVKRTKQKLEEGTTAGEVKRVCTQSSTTTDDKSDRLTTEIDSVAVETYNPMLLHHMPSPTPRRRDSSPTQEHNLKVETNRNSPSPVGSIDISLTSMRQIGRLSTSAPAPSSLPSESDLPLSLRSCRSESETSSPCVVNTTQCPSVKHHKMVLENLCNKSVFSKRCLSVDDSPEAECPRSTSGIVKNLKKEFEAKSTKLEKSPENACEGENASVTARPKRDVKIRSLPSSPVIPHNESKIQSLSSVGETKENKHGRRSETTPPSSQDNMEDLSVRVLVGKYEVARPESRKSSDIQLRAHKDKDWDALEVHPPAKSKIAPELSRRSAPIMINNHSAPLFNETPEAPGRPPAVPSPSVVMASVVAKAASKKQQQHGRTHPLARLQVRPRHSSPVYNTM